MNKIHSYITPTDHLKCTSILRLTQDNETTDGGLHTNTIVIECQKQGDHEIHMYAINDRGETRIYWG